MACRFVALICVIALSGCAVVETNVTRYTTLPARSTEVKTFAFANEPKSLEESHYQNLISLELEKKNWSKAPKSTAQYRVEYRYGVDGGTYTSSESPVFGVTNAGGPVSTFGTIRSANGNTASYSGTSWTPATYGQVGSVSSSGFSYRRYFDIKIIETRTNTPVYEGRALSSGASGNIGAVLPEIIKATFIAFPGKNGSNNTYSIPTTM